MSRNFTVLFVLFSFFASADVRLPAIISSHMVVQQKTELKFWGWCEPGEKIQLDKLPDGRISLRAARPSGKIDSFVGLLAGKTKKVASLKELDEAAAEGWAGKR